MNFLGFGQSAEVDIVFDGTENRKYAEVKTEDGKKEKYLLYYDGETVSGKVNVTLKKPGSKLEHQGIKIELIGQIELFYDRGNHHEFTSLVKELARPGDLIQNTSYPFEFPNVEKPYEVYVGSNVRLRYFLRVTIVRRISDIIREVDIAVHTLCSYPDLNNPIKMEVGIEDCLHIEFEYNKSKYHLKDVIVGKIYFLLVRIKIKHMEIAIIKRETTGSGPNTFTENETIAKYEIMDGAPVKGESIPIRVFLAGYDLTPTMRDINKKFSVKYFLNLVLMDTEDRRYFKQQEITLWRKADKSRKMQMQSVNPHVPTHLVGGPEAAAVAAAAAAAAASINNSASNNFANSGNLTTNSDNSENVITSVGGGGGDGGGDERPTTDARMGLFTRESPQQEVKQIITGEDKFQHQQQQQEAMKSPLTEGGTGTEATASGTTIAPLSSPTLGTIISTEMQRGTADGASAKSDGLLEESSSLFDGAVTVTATATLPPTATTITAATAVATATATAAKTSPTELSDTSSNYPEGSISISVKNTTATTTTASTSSAITTIAGSSLTTTTTATTTTTTTTLSTSSQDGGGGGGGSGSDGVGADVSAVNAGPGSRMPNEQNSNINSNNNDSAAASTTAPIKVASNPHLISD